MQNLEAIKIGIARSYDRAYKEYMELFGNELEKYPYDRQLIDRLVNGLPQNARVCDIGCGPTAYIGSYLLNKGANIYGIDISVACIRNAKSMFPEMNLYVMDMMDTAFGDNFFDGLLSFYSIYHISKEYLLKVFLEYHRILKPKGKVMLVTHKGTFTDTLTTLWGHDDLELYASFHLENEIERLFVDGGFAIDRLESRDTVYEFPKERIVALAEKI